MTDQEALDAPDPAVCGPQHRPDGPADGTAELCLPAGAGPGETNWRRLRAYLGVFESYSLYLHIPQKVQTLAFLYELLMHRGDIRRQAAALHGGRSSPGSTQAMSRSARRTAARTQVCPRTWTSGSCTCKRIIYPDHKLMPQHQRWIHYT